MNDKEFFEKICAAVSILKQLTETVDHCGHSTPKDECQDCARYALLLTSVCALYDLQDLVAEQGASR